LGATAFVAGMDSSTHEYRARSNHARYLLMPAVQSAQLCKLHNGSKAGSEYSTNEREINPPFGGFRPPNGGFAPPNGGFGRGRRPLGGGCPVLVWLDQSLAHGVHGRLGAIRHIELLQDVLNVRLDRRRADEEQFADLLVGMSIRNQT
jgi:hypothetical protein